MDSGTESGEGENRGLVPFADSPCFERLEKRQFGEKWLAFPSGDGTRRGLRPLDAGFGERFEAGQSSGGALQISHSSNAGHASNGKDDGQMPRSVAKLSSCFFAEPFGKELARFPPKTMASVFCKPENWFF